MYNIKVKAVHEQGEVRYVPTKKCPARLGDDARCMTGLYDRTKTIKCEHCKDIHVGLTGNAAYADNLYCGCMGYENHHAKRSKEEYFKRLRKLGCIVARPADFHLSGQYLHVESNKCPIDGTCLSVDMIHDDYEECEHCSGFAQEHCIPYSVLCMHVTNEVEAAQE